MSSDLLQLVPWQSLRCNSRIQQVSMQTLKWIPLGSPHARGVIVYCIFHVVPHNWCRESSSREALEWEGKQVWKNLIPETSKNKRQTNYQEQPMWHVLCVWVTVRWCYRTYHSVEAKGWDASSVSYTQAGCRLSCVSRDGGRNCFPLLHMRKGLSHDHSAKWESQDSDTNLLTSWPCTLSCLYILFSQS